MAVDAQKPTLPEYAADLAKRMDKSLPGNATILAVGILGFAAEDDRIDEHERKMAKSWLDRLVDEEGNPKGDDGLMAGEWACVENTINHNGSLTLLYKEQGGINDDPRIVFEFKIREGVKQQIARDELAATVLKHFTAQVEHIVALIYDEPPHEMQNGADPS